MRNKYDFRLSESQKNKERGKELINRLVPEYFGTSVNELEYRKDLSNYRLYNNLIDQKEFEEVCNPWGLPKNYKLDVIRPYNKTYLYIDVLRGEEIKRSDKPNAVAIGQKSIGYKNFELYQLYQQSVQQEIDKTFKEVEMMMQGAEPEQIDAMKEQMSALVSPNDIDPTNFKSELEIFANSVIDFANYDQELTDKRNDGFFHLLIAGREMVYVGRKGVKSKPEIEVLNPLYVYYDKDNDEKYVHKGNWACSRRMMSPYSVIKNWGDQMTKTERERVLGSNSLQNEYYGLPGKKMNYERDKTFTNRNAQGIYASLGGTRDEFFDDPHGLYGASYNAIPGLYQENVPVVHMEWRWLRKVGFLTFLNDFGDEETIVVDEYFKVPKDATKVKFRNKFNSEATRFEWYDATDNFFMLEWLWIDDIWEGTRIDQDIFVNIRRKDNSPVNPNSPYEKNLGYYGIKLSASNAENISIMGRMKPYNYLYMATLYKIGELIAKQTGPIQNIDTSMMDTDFSQSKDPQEIMNKYLYFRQRGIAFYNGLNNTQGNPNASHRGQTNKVENVSTSADIANLIQVAQLLEQEIGKAAGISPQRAAQFSRDSNVSDNQQAITQSAHMTEHVFKMHNGLWKHIIDGYVGEFARFAEGVLHDSTVDEHYLQYVLPNKSTHTLQLLPEHIHNLTEVGIFTSNAGDSSRYIEDMRNLSLTLLQNDQATIVDISNILKAYSQGVSPEEVHKMLEIAFIDKNKREQQAQQAQQEAEARMEQKRLKDLQGARAHELRKIELEELLERETKIMLQDTELQHDRQLEASKEV